MFYSVAFTAAAALVHELMEARDERRLRALQKHLNSVKLLIIDELGYVVFHLCCCFGSATNRPKRLAISPNVRAPDKA
jgi:IstB-like ATP binding protein